MFLKLLLISSLFLVIVFAGLGIRLLLLSNGSFPETHISKNKELTKRGITCAQHTDTGCVPDFDSGGCSACEIRKL